MLQAYIAVVLFTHLLGVKSFDGSSNTCNTMWTFCVQRGNEKAVPVVGLCDEGPWCSSVMNNPGCEHVNRFFLLFKIYFKFYIYFITFKLITSRRAKGKPHIKEPSLLNFHTSLEHLYLIQCFPLVVSIDIH